MVKRDFAEHGIDGSRARLGMNSIALLCILGERDHLYDELIAPHERKPLIALGRKAKRRRTLESTQAAWLQREQQRKAKRDEQSQGRGRSGLGGTGGRVHPGHPGRMQLSLV